MSTNFFLMEKSELEIFQALDEFFLHVINMHTQINTYLDQEQIITNDDYDMIVEDEEKADHYYHGILSDCMWTIQKDQPRASHLRFIISAINSAKDFERACDYAKDIAKILKEKAIYDKELLKVTCAVYKQGIDLMQKFHAVYLAKETHEFTKNKTSLVSDYHDFVKQSLKEVIKISKNIEDEKSYQWHINLIIVINKIERAVEHIYNVVKAFSYINFDI